MKHVFTSIWIILFILSLGLTSCGEAQKSTATSLLGRFAVENRVTSSVVSKKIQDMIDNDISRWISNQKIIQAILESNKENASRNQADIDALDKKWQDGDDQFINSYLNRGKY
jgi:hypothetical protein